MLDCGLSSQQLAFVCALSSGVNIAAAAEQAGVHRDTISHWRRNSLPFQHAFEHAQYDRALYFREKAGDLIDLALQAIHQILADPQTPPSVRLKAALAIIATATTPPASIEKIVFKPQAEALTDDQLASETPDPPASEPTGPLHAAPVNPAPTNHRAQPAVASEPPTAASPRLPSVHNLAQTRKATRPDVGRNSACPCGSGKKFKRCCLDKQVSQESVQRVLSAA